MIKSINVPTSNGMETRQGRTLWLDLDGIHKRKFFLQVSGDLADYASGFILVHANTIKAVKLRHVRTGHRITDRAAAQHAVYSLVNRVGIGEFVHRLNEQDVINP